VNIEVGELRKLMQQAQLAAEKEKAIFGEVRNLHNQGKKLRHVIIFFYKPARKYNEEQS